MMVAPSRQKPSMRPLRLKRYLLTGLLTFIPLWVTWLVFKFVLGLLADIGAPLVAALLGALALLLGGVAAWFGGRMGAVDPTVTEVGRVPSGTDLSRVTSVRS